MSRTFQGGGHLGTNCKGRGRTLAGGWGAGGRRARGGVALGRQKLAPHPIFCHYRNRGGPPGVSAELPAGKSLPQRPLHPSSPQAQLCPPPSLVPSRLLCWGCPVALRPRGGGGVHAGWLCPSCRSSLYHHRPLVYGKPRLRATQGAAKTPVGGWVALSRWEALAGLPPSEPWVGGLCPPHF